MTKQRSLRFWLWMLGLPYLGCTKIIDVNLNSASPQIVIEAQVDNIDVSHNFVKLSRTINFSDLNAFPPVSGARVRILTDAGTPYELIENKDTLGLYQHPTLLGEPLRTYYLYVEVEGKQYTSSCTMPALVPLTKVLFNRRPSIFNRAGDTTYNTVPYFDATTTKHETFLVRQRINTIMDSTVYERRSVNGIPNVQIRPLVKRVYIHDTVEVYFSAVSEEVYNYFYVLNMRATTSITPSNPTSLIVGNGVIGYFNAQATDYQKLIAGE